MDYSLVDDYIREVTKDMGTRQQSEVTNELRTHILDSVDALAAERKTTVDDAIINEVLAKMGPADHVAAMYRKSASHTRSGRPKIVPPPSKADLVVEAISLIGLLLNIGLILYGIIYLPENIPTHVGPSGGVDSFGNKWVLMSVFFFTTVPLYALITIANKYPYIFNYPTIVTEENAPRLYRLAGSMIRWMKAIFVWMAALLAWEFILVLPSNPGQSVDTSLILLTMPILLVIVLGYYVIKLQMASKPRNKNIDS